MGGEHPTAYPGMLYTGDFKNERIYTLILNTGMPHVCIKEKSSRKRIVAVFETLGDAEDFLNRKSKEG